MLLSKLLVSAILPAAILMETAAWSPPSIASIIRAALPNRIVRELCVSTNFTITRLHMQAAYPSGSPAVNIMKVDDVTTVPFSDLTDAHCPAPSYFWSTTQSARMAEDNMFLWSVIEKKDEETKKCAEASISLEQSLGKTRHELVFATRQSRERASQLQRLTTVNEIMTRKMGEAKAELDVERETTESLRQSYRDLLVASQHERHASDVRLKRYLLIIFALVLTLVAVLVFFVKREQAHSKTIEDLRDSKLHNLGQPAAHNYHAEEPEEDSEDMNEAEMTGTDTLVDASEKDDVEADREKEDHSAIELVEDTAIVTDSMPADIPAATVPAVTDLPIVFAVPAISRALAGLVVPVISRVFAGLAVRSGLAAPAASAMPAVPIVSADNDEEDPSTTEQNLDATPVADVIPTDINVPTTPLAVATVPAVAADITALAVPAVPAESEEQDLVSGEQDVEIQDSMTADVAVPVAAAPTVPAVAEVPAFPAAAPISATAPDSAQASEPRISPQDVEKDNELIRAAVSLASSLRATSFTLDDPNVREALETAHEMALVCLKCLKKDLVSHLDIVEMEMFRRPSVLIRAWRWIIQWTRLIFPNAANLTANVTATPG